MLLYSTNLNRESTFFICFVLFYFNSDKQITSQPPSPDQVGDSSDRGERERGGGRRRAFGGGRLQGGAAYRASPGEGFKSPEWLTLLVQLMFVLFVANILNC